MAALKKWTDDIALTPAIRAIPKADIHVHLEGTITPDMVRKLAARNNVDIPDGLIDAQNKFAWQDDGTAAGALVGFLGAYDAATSVMKTAGDYTDITYDYLTRSAAEGCIYAEITISPDHGRQVGLDYPAMLAAIEKAVNRARRETGIETRLIATCVRHYGADAAREMAKIVRGYPHPLVTGFGMAGDENAGVPADFAPAFDTAALANRTAHAGEAAGSVSIRAARDHLRVRRFGHMVRAIDDAVLLQELKTINAVPEVCVSSNRVLKVFPTAADHPLRKFFDAGFKVTIGSDDPPFFDTSIGKEYQIAADCFGLAPAALLRITRNAIEEAFIDEPTRRKLLQKLDDTKPQPPRPAPKN